MEGKQAAAVFRYRGHPRELRECILILEAGIDYIAMSLPADILSQPSWRAECSKTMALLADHGFQVRSGTYQGYEGLWVGGSFFGERDDGAHVHISGAWAGKLWSALHHEQAHYSRLDLQVTFQFAQEDRLYGERMRELAGKKNDERATAQKRKIRDVREYGGGYTLYIGSRNSAHFCRLYDKGAESGAEEYERCWRYEVEMHGRPATQAARFLYNSGKGIARIAATTVWRYYHERGIDPPWDRDDEEGALQPAPAPITDIERKLNWLRTQVRPTVAYLRDNVPRAILDGALGLIDPASEPDEPTAFV
jgi:DNA relaxase NicK